MTCYKNADIAEAAGVSVATIKRYKKDPEFNAVLNERRAAVVGAAVDRMVNTILNDVDVLQSIIDNDAVNPAVRVTAINTKWGHLREWQALINFDKRLRALESLNIADLSRLGAGGGQS